MAWHHIVEQCKAKKFGVKRIQNIDNVVAIPSTMNQKLNGLYSSIRPNITGSRTLTVREWLDKKTFEYNRDFGFEAIRKVECGEW